MSIMVVCVKTNFGGVRWLKEVFLPGASFGLLVLSLPASVCICIRSYVCVNPELVHDITHHPFKLGSPNLAQRCKTPYDPYHFRGN